MEPSKTNYEDLVQYIENNSVEALNNNPSYPPKNCIFERDTSYIQSENGDPQLLISFSFTHALKVHHIVVVGGKDAKARPKTIKLFANHGNMDFGSAENDEPTQTIELKDDSFGKPLELRYVKFQNVRTLTVFIEDNFGDKVTQISQLIFYGASSQSTDVKNLKPVDDDH